MLYHFIVMRCWPVEFASPKVLYEGMKDFRVSVHGMLILELDFWRIRVCETAQLSFDTEVSEWRLHQFRAKLTSAM
jgi:hypothetical protein